MAAGRPTKYKPEYCELAYKYCLLGATDVRLAEFFGVDQKTIYSWQAKYPEFLQSIKKGKDQADAEIAASLFHRAKGYSHPEDKIFQGTTENGPVIVPTIKHYPPDTTAGIFWLKNRRAGEWSDKKELHVTQDPIQSLLDQIGETSTLMDKGSAVKH